MSNDPAISDHNGEKAEELAMGYKQIDRLEINPELFSFLKRAANEDRILRILDIGCGSGNDAIEMANIGHSIVGVEPSDLRMIAIRDQSHPDIDYRDGKLPCLSTVISDEEKFDVILLSAVFQYIKPFERVDALKEIALKLKEGGKLFINYPSPPSRQYQYECGPADLEKAIQEANEDLPQQQKLKSKLQPSIIPDTRGRKSSDGRNINFYYYKISSDPIKLGKDVRIASKPDDQQGTRVQAPPPRKLNI